MHDDPQPIDGHVRFAAEWDGQRHIIFVLDQAIEHEAGATLDREQAAAYVLAHRDRFLDEAKRIAARYDIPPGRTITIDELDAPG